MLREMELFWNIIHNSGQNIILGQNARKKKQRQIFNEFEFAIQIKTKKNTKIIKIIFPDAHSTNANAL